MDCKKVHEELSAYIDGVLEEPLLIQVEAHLRACPGCAAEAEELREVVGMVRALGDIAPPEELCGQVIARIKTEAGDAGAAAGAGAVVAGADVSGGAGVLKYFARHGQFIAAAAVLVLGIGISVLWGKGLGPANTLNPAAGTDKSGSLAGPPAEKKSETVAGMPEDAKIAMEDRRDKSLAVERNDALQNFDPNLSRKSMMTETADRVQSTSRGPGAKTKNSGMVISEGLIKISVQDMAYTESRVDKIAADFGGRVEKSGRLLQVVVPGDKFDQAAAALERLGRITDKNLNTRDVSSEYSDLESRIGGLEMKENQLTELAGNTVSPVEKASVEEDLGRTREELSLLREQLAQLDSAVNFATITIELSRQG